jgi:hypothetical protein
MMYLRRCCLLWRSQRRAGKELPKGQKSKIERGAKDIIEENVHFPCLTKPTLQQRSIQYQSLDVPHTGITRGVNATKVYVLCLIICLHQIIRALCHPIAYRAIAIALFA